MDKFTDRYMTALIILLAFLLRLPEFFISLAYDEIWTLSNFAPLPVRRLLFDLELPNNHPLNSILIKILSNWSPSAEFIRLPNLLAGLGCIALMGLLLKQFHGRIASWAGMLFMAVNAPLVVYSMQARGYTLQLFFLMLYAYSTVTVAQNKLSGRRRLVYHLLILSSVLCAIITLPTSALYLLGITLILWNYYHWRIKPQPWWGTLLLSGALALFYILLNLSGLLAARQWGEDVSGASGFICFLGKTLYLVLPLGILPFALVGIWRERKYLPGTAAALMLIFGSAYFTNGGGARVYLPLTLLAIYYAAIGVTTCYQAFAENHRKILFPAVFILVGASFFLQMPLWSFPNYHPVISTVEKLPPETLTVFPAGDSYPALWNSNGKMAIFYAHNLENKSRKRTLLLINRRHIISGMDGTFAEKNFPMPFSGQSGSIDRLPTTSYELEAITGDFPADRPVIAVLHLIYTNSTFKTWRSKIQALSQNPGDVLFLNGFFTVERIPAPSVCIFFIFTIHLLKK